MTGRAAEGEQCVAVPLYGSRAGEVWVRLWLPGWASPYAAGLSWRAISAIISWIVAACSQRWRSRV